MFSRLQKCSVLNVGFVTDILQKLRIYPKSGSFITHWQHFKRPIEAPFCGHNDSCQRNIPWIGAAALRDKFLSDFVTVKDVVSNVFMIVLLYFKCY